MAQIDWSTWPVLEVRATGPQPTCYASVVIDTLRAGVRHGGRFAVVVIGEHVEPSATARRMPVLGPVDTRWLRHCRGPLAERCRGIAYVTQWPAVGLPDCITTSFSSVDAARQWARGRVDSSLDAVATGAVPGHALEPV